MHGNPPPQPRRPAVLRDCHPCPRLAPDADEPAVKKQHGDLESPTWRKEHRVRRPTSIPALSRSACSPPKPTGCVKELCHGRRCQALAAALCHETQPDFINRFRDCVRALAARFGATTGAGWYGQHTQLSTTAANPLEPRAAVRGAAHTKCGFPASTGGMISRVPPPAPAQMTNF